VREEGSIRRRRGSIGASFREERATTLSPKG
jgi:hypothetical protein